MSGISCTCDDPSFGHAGRPNCVITQGALAFPVFSPKRRENGSRNFLPTNAAGIQLFNAEYGVSFNTLKECVDYRLDASTPVQDKLYPILKVENATFERSESQFETFPSGRKIKIEGVGGIRTWAMELVDKDAVFGVARALEKFGCYDIDGYYFDVKGNCWGVQDSYNSGIVRGYEIDTGSLESFMIMPTDTTSQKISLSFDLDAFECESNSWALTPEEYGSNFTTIEPLIEGFASAESVNDTTTVVTLTTNFGTAGSKGKIVGLAQDLTAANANLVIKNSSGVVQPATAASEGLDGVYTLRTASLSAGDFTVESKAKGYYIPVSKFTV